MSSEVVNPIRQRAAMRWFSDALGYGFAQTSDFEDVFLHYRKILCDGFQTLPAGATVEYTLMDGPKGAYGVDIVLIDVEAE